MYMTFTDWKSWLQVILTSTQRGSSTSSPAFKNQALIPLLKMSLKQSLKTYRHKNIFYFFKISLRNFAFFPITFLLQYNFTKTFFFFWSCLNIFDQQRSLSHTFQRFCMLLSNKCICINFEIAYLHKKKKKGRFIWKKKPYILTAALKWEELVCGRHSDIASQKFVFKSWCCWFNML